MRIADLISLCFLLFIEPPFFFAFRMESFATRKSLSSSGRYNNNKTRHLAMSTTNSHRLNDQGDTDSTSSDDLKPQLLVSLRDRLVKNGGGYSSSECPLAKLVLASQSPRRREILDMMGLASLYDVEPSPLDESQLQSGK
jgi:hypothetical protein